MTHFLSKLALAAAFAAAPFALSSASAADIGLLGCHSDGSTGFVIGSSDKLVCQFTPAGDGPRELYAGNLDKFGLDVGVTGRTTMQWAVVSAGTSPYQPNSLAGSYSGASASASAVVGVGANVLVGGGDSGLTLQPVSVQEQEGINAALGVAKLTLVAGEPVVTGQEKAPIAVDQVAPGTVVPK